MPGAGWRSTEPSGSPEPGHGGEQGTPSAIRMAGVAEGLEELERSLDNGEKKQLKETGLLPQRLTAPVTCT
jgi:hypothetical protein